MNTSFFRDGLKKQFLKPDENFTNIHSSGWIKVHILQKYPCTSSYQGGTIKTFLLKGWMLNETMKRDLDLRNGTSSSRNGKSLKHY